MRIVFWGSPEFALPSFRALIGEGHDVMGVVTQPDRPVGRHRELRAPPVKTAALEEGVPVAQPEKAVGPEFMRWLTDLAHEPRRAEAGAALFRFSGPEQESR